MEYRYFIQSPDSNYITRLNANDFNKILFNETILNVVHKQITKYNDVIIYEMLSYDVDDDSANIFYLIVKRTIKE